MADALGQVDVVIRADLGAFDQDLARARDAVTKFNDSINKSTGQANQGFQKVNQNAKQLKDNLNEGSQAASAFEKATELVVQQLTALGLVLSIKELQALSDEWTDMRGRLRAILGDFGRADEALQSLAKTSTITHTSMQATADAFADSSTALKELGYSTATQLKYLEALNIALAASGARGERAAAVQYSLSRALAIGSLRSYALNTILTNGDKVAEAIAKHLGVTTLELRKLGQQGKITSDVIVQSILEARGSLEALAKQLPPTMHDSMEEMRKAVMIFVGSVDTALGVTQHQAIGLQNLASTIRGAAIPAVAGIATAFQLANNFLGQFQLSMPKLIQTMDQLFGVIGVGAVTLLTLSLAVRGLTVAFKLLSFVIVANPFVLLIAGAAAAIVAIYTFRDSISQAIGQDVIQIFKNVGNFIIAVFKFAFEGVVALWQDLPDIMEALGIQIQNAWIRIINAIAVAWANGLNSIINGINAVQPYLKLLGVPSGQLGNVTALQHQEIANTAAARLELRNGLRGLQNDIQKTFSTDYIGQFFTIFDQSMGKASEIVKSLLDSVDALTGQVDQRTVAAIKKMTLQSQKFVEQQQLEANVLGETTKNAQAERYAFQLLYQLKEADIAITPELIDLTKKQGKAMAEAEDQTKKLSDAFGFVKDSFRGFVSDLGNGLRQGKTFFQSFTDAALNLLDKVINKLEDVAVEALFSAGSINGAGGVGGGGILSTLVKVAGSLLGITAHAGGIVGEMGVATRRMPMGGLPRLHYGGMLGSDEVPAILQRGETVLPRGARYGSQGGKVEVVVHTTESPYFDTRVDARSAGVAVRVVNATDKQKSRTAARTQ